MNEEDSILKKNSSKIQGIVFACVVQFIHDSAVCMQVADFGLAKLSNDTHTHVSTRIMGTFGYAHRFRQWHSFFFSLQ